MLNISDVTGAYTESGQWWDSQGNTGRLQGSIEVSIENDALRFKLDGGHVMSTDPIEGYAPARLEGSGGGVTTSGMAYVADRTLILEYVADVQGREERNTDVWTLSSNAPTRGGVIRQDARTIWFEASMQPAS